MNSPTVSKIAIWDVHTGKIIRNLIGHNEDIAALFFSPDGQILFTIAYGNIINHIEPSAIFWDVATGNQLKVIAGSSLLSYDSFLKQEKDSSLKDGWYGRILQQAIRLEEIYSELDKVGDHPNFFAEYIPLNLLTLSIEGTNQIQIWNFKTNEKILAFFANNYISSLSFNPSGLLLAGLTSDGIVIWDIATGKIVGQEHWGNIGHPTSSGLLPDGHWVIAGSIYPDTAYLFDPVNGVTILSINVGNTGDVLINPNGKIMAIKNYSSEKGELGFSLWNIDDKKKIFSDPSSIYSMAFSPDGHYLATAGSPGGLKLWDFSNQSTPTSISIKSPKSTNRVLFSEDGKYLFSGDWDATINIWQMPSGQPIRTLNSSFATYFDVSPNGRTLVYISGQDITQLVFLDITQILAPTNQNITAPFFIQNNELKFAFSYSPNGKIFTWGQSYTYGDAGQIELWDTQNQTPLTELTGHPKPISFLAFSPDGQYLVSSGGDQTIRLWGIKP